MKQPIGPRILLVDDLAMHRRMLALRLGPGVGEMAAVASAAEAEAYLVQRHPALILLDVVMPGKDGFALCAELKAAEATRDIAVVMLTDLKEGAFQRSMDAGADDHLPKRAQDPVLRLRVHLHLHLQELRLRDAGRTWTRTAASILLATRSPTLAAQLPAQFQAEGHRTRVVESLEGLPDACGAEDRLLILDAGVDPAALPEALRRLRSDPHTAGLPVLLLAEKAELPLLNEVEAMVDDVLWKPLLAKRTRHRVQFLLELGARTFGS